MLCQEKVLLVEDDPGLGDLFSLKLSEFGYSTSIARTGEEAIQKYEQGVHNVIVVDYNIPGEYNGLDILRYIKSKKDSPPVIILTGHGNERIAVEALRCGAANYIIKDVNLHYLALLISAIESEKSHCELKKKVLKNEEMMRSLRFDLEKRMEPFKKKLARELKTPLASAQKFLEIFMEKQSDKFEEEDCQYIQNAQELLRQIEKITNKLFQEKVPFIK